MAHVASLFYLVIDGWLLGDGTPVAEIATVSFLVDKDGSASFLSN